MTIRNRCGKPIRTILNGIIWMKLSTKPCWISESGCAKGERATTASLTGFPLADTEDMPDIATGSLSIAFGDFRRGYLIVDRAGVRVLRDPYSAKPYVLFYTTKRVGGGVQDFDAIKLLKFSVS
jgi:predicted phage gp36 major capsid-like protein